MKLEDEEIGERIDADGIIGKTFIKLRNDNEQLQQENQALKKQVGKRDKKIVELMQDINNLDEGIHNHKDPHWKMWEIVLADKDKKIKELEKQLSEIKYLDRRNVWELIDKYKIRIIDDKGFVSDICSLALPTRERIVEVLEKHLCIKRQYEDEGVEVTWTNTDAPDIEAIASEILGDDKNEI
jgi:predicted RNase H-like nuclease (RuvC/YqgF family)